MKRPTESGGRRMKKLRQQQAGGIGETTLTTGRFMLPVLDNFPMSHSSSRPAAPPLVSMITSGTSAVRPATKSGGTRRWRRKGKRQPVSGRPRPSATGVGHLFAAGGWRARGAGRARRIRSDGRICGRGGGGCQSTMTSGKQPVQEGNKQRERMLI